VLAAAAAHREHEVVADEDIDLAHCDLALLLFQQMDHCEPQPG
jgi:hypothetical protein